MRTAHNISKKLRYNPHASSRIGTLDSRPGTMIRCGDNNKTHKTLNSHNSHNFCSSQRTHASSKRGTDEGKTNGRDFNLEAGFRRETEDNRTKNSHKNDSSSNYENYE